MKTTHKHHLLLTAALLSVAGKATAGDLLINPTLQWSFSSEGKFHGVSTGQDYGSAFSDSGVVAMSEPGTDTLFSHNDNAPYFLSNNWSGSGYSYVYGTDQIRFGFSGELGMGVVYLGVAEREADLNIDVTVTFQLTDFATLLHYGGQQFGLQYYQNPYLNKGVNTTLTQSLNVTVTTPASSISYDASYTDANGWQTTGGLHGVVCPPGLYTIHYSGNANSRYVGGAATFAPSLLANLTLTGVAVPAPGSGSGGVVADGDGDGSFDVDDLCAWDVNPFDANGDGLIDDDDRAFLVSMLEAMGQTVPAGADSLVITPSAPQPGETLAFEMTGGQPLTPVYWLISSVNGASTFQVLLVDAFDNDGTWHVETPTPAGLSGLELGMKTAGVNSCGEVVLTAEKVVSFQ